MRPPRNNNKNDTRCVNIGGVDEVKEINIGLYVFVILF